MEEKDIKSRSAFITHDVLTETQEKLEKKVLDAQRILKDELTKRMDKGDSSMEKLGNKVDVLNDMVLPLLAFTEATAKNTERMAVSFDDFAKSQRTKNDEILTRQNNQEVAIEGLKHTTDGIKEKKRYNATIVVGAMTLIGVIVTSIFQFAPTIVPHIFK